MNAFFPFFSDLVQREKKSKKWESRTLTKKIIKRTLTMRHYSKNSNKYLKGTIESVRWKKRKKCQTTECRSLVVVTKVVVTNSTEQINVNRSLKWYTRSSTKWTKSKLSLAERNRRNNKRSRSSIVFEDRALSVSQLIKSDRAFARDTRYLRTCPVLSARAFR